MNKNIYIREKESSEFEEIENMAKKLDRGLGYVIIQIYREWKELKQDLTLK